MTSRERRRAGAQLIASALALLVATRPSLAQQPTTPAPSEPSTPATAPVEPAAPAASPAEPAPTPSPSPTPSSSAEPASAAATPSTVAGGRSEAVVGMGVFGLDSGEDQAGVFDMEVRWRPMVSSAWLRIEPVVGAAISSHGTMYARAGLGRDFPFASRWNTNITLAAGGYLVGNGKNLGRGVEFRSAIELSCLLGPQMRLGLSLAHLSNAGLGDHNPGIETLAITFGWLDPFVSGH